MKVRGQKNRRGFTLLEILMGMMVTGVLVWLVQNNLVSLTRMNRHSILSAQLKADLNYFGVLIGKVGRAASTCTQTAASTLECDVDLNVPPSGALTKVRFNASTDANGVQVLNYDQFQGGVWKTYQTAAGLTSFTVCDESRVNAGTCALLPITAGKDINSFYTAYGGHPAPNRYFRFEIKGRVSQDAPGSVKGTGSLQSAFYVRNPGEQGSYYHWGMQ